MGTGSRQLSSHDLHYFWIFRRISVQSKVFGLGEYFSWKIIVTDSLATVNTSTEIETECLIEILSPNIDSDDSISIDSCFY